MKILSVAPLSQAKKSEGGTAHFLGLDSYRTLYDTPQQCQTLVLSMKPLQKLTGTDRRTAGQMDGQTDGQTDGAGPRIESG